LHRTSKLPSSIGIAGSAAAVPIRVGGIMAAGTTAKLTANTPSTGAS
jgi:hypothetical protein